jgi:hypothetical protein
MHVGALFGKCLVFRRPRFVLGETAQTVIAKWPSLENRDLQQLDNLPRLD